MARQRNVGRIAVLLLALVSTLAFGLAIPTSNTQAQTYSSTNTPSVADIVANTATATTTPNLNFPLCEIARSLSLGSSGEDVRCLQRYLNYSGFIVAATGPGSPGFETQYFGTLTQQAVMRWQNAHATNVLTPYGIPTGTGYWGSLSFNHYVFLAKAALRVL